MKKTYIAPKSISVELDMDTLIAESIALGEETQLQDMDVKEENDLLRGKNLWDELW